MYMTYGQAGKTVYSIKGSFVFLMEAALVLCLSSTFWRGNALSRAADGRFAVRENPYLNQLSRSYLPSYNSLS